MKILLIKPRYFDRKHRTFFSICIPPMGLTYLASVLINRGFDVSVLDMEAMNMDEAGFYKYLKYNKPDVVGIDVRTPLVYKAARIASMVKKYSRSIKVIIGGPHLFVMPGNALEIVEDADFGLRGECEFTLCELIEGIAVQRPLSQLQDIKGICLRFGGGNFFISPEIPLIEDLNSLPMPSHHLLPMNKYFDDFLKRKRYYSVMTTRGCPYGCIFCGQSLLYGRKIRERSVENVLDEVEVLLNKYHVSCIGFLDATFNYSAERVKAICRGIIKRNLAFDWRVKARVDSVDYDALSLMKRAGCKLVSYGVESVSDRTLGYLNKGYVKEDVLSAFRLTERAGIDICGYFLLGNLNESKDDCIETIKFAKKLNPLYAQFMYPLPLPGTQLYKGLKQKNLIIEDWSNFYFHRLNFTHPKIHERELRRLCLKAYFGFYFRFSYFLRQFRNAEDLFHLLRKLRMGIIAFLYIIKEVMFKNIRLRFFERVRDK